MEERLGGNPRGSVTSNLRHQGDTSPIKSMSNEITCMNATDSVVDAIAANKRNESSFTGATVSVNVFCTRHNIFVTVSVSHSTQFYSSCTQFNVSLEQNW